MREATNFSRVLININSFEKLPRADVGGATIFFGFDRNWRNENQNGAWSCD